MSAIEYSDKRTVKKLVIEDANGDIAYSYGTKKKASKPKKEEPKEEPKPVEPQLISVGHAKEIKDGLEATDSNVSAFLSLFKVPSVDEMHESMYPKAIQMIEKKRQKNAQKGA